MSRASFLRLPPIGANAGRFGLGIVIVRQRDVCITGRSRTPGLLEGDRTASGPARQWQRLGYFPPALTRLCIAKQNSRASAILCFAPALPLSLRVLVRSARRLVIATKAAVGAADPVRGLSS
jgi:hypothetical protein